MPSHFDLIITADHPSRTAELQLLDAHGSHLAYRQTDFNTIAAGLQRGLFDLRNYLQHYVEPGREIASVAEIGVCIAEQVLGEEIFNTLWQSESQRTLRIQLPGATEAENHLAAALARVPWEIARPAVDQPTLGERNLLIRVVHDMQAPPTDPLEFGKDESLRVLFVFAEARGSRPLAARQERHELRQLFDSEIYPNRRIVADFLTHGVTRERLKSQIEENGGYHIVHWSGHGHLNLLELAKPGGAGDRLSGDQLLDLFTESGGFIPRLFFLSACHSGDILRAKDWNEFMAIAQGKELVSGKALAAGFPPHEAPAASAVPHTATKQIELEALPGYTGTAHALLQGGVPSVVAMRYAVGDDYARELGVEFYRALLAHAKPKNVAEALTMARNALLVPKKNHDRTRYSVCDHATPVLYGSEQPGLTLQKGRSPALDTRNPRLHQITELTLAGHEHFVGRTWELAELGSDFIGSSRGVEVKPVAVITGLGGMGKTALTAESLALWESRFEWVLLYQAKPNPLSFEATLRDIHLKLNGELGRYHDHVTAHRADAIHREASAEFTGPARLERLTRNLIRAMKDEPILLVLDNFETNLKPTANPNSPPNTSTKRKRVSGQLGERVSESASPGTEDSLAGASCLYASQDPAWDRCLALLAGELIDAPSRVLITCRRPLAVLPETVAHHVVLGPLPSGEAALYLRDPEGLGKLFFSHDEAESKLARRLLTASRFHPLLMDRLTRLALGGESLRPQLLQVLIALETSHDYSQLPELFATDRDDAKELAYLNDALATSLDQLIHEASPDARRLLWMIAIANDPVALGLLRGVWSGEDHEQQQLRQIKQMLDMLPQLPAELQAELKALPPELRAVLDALPPEPPARPEIEPLLRHLIDVGLVTEERTGPDDNNPDLACHELVRERIRVWMSERPQDQVGGRALLPDNETGKSAHPTEENAIRLAYAERLEAAFNALQHQNMTLALQAGSRAVVYCVQAEAWDRLGGFASRLVTSTNDPRLLEGLIPHLRTAAESAPEGRPRWSCLCYLADALRMGGRPDLSLPFYEQAADLARAATVSGTALAAGVRDTATAAGLGHSTDVDSPAASAVPLTSASRQTWADLAWITGNWAHALRYVGNLDAARQRQLEAAEAYKKAGDPGINVIGRELEALRIDIMQGQVANALPQVETRLAQVAAWWERHRSGQSVPEAPDAEFLARVYIGALDIANDADRASDDLVSALRRTDAILEVKRALERPAEDIASTRMNRAVELAQLQRFGEAQAELEACLAVFQHDTTRSARTLGSLADLFDKQGDVAQAITQERRALALGEQLPDPADRAISHGSLANYLKRHGTPSALAESPRHQLAALIYRLVAGLGQHLQHSLRNYTIDFRRARAAGTELAVPRVAELLADSAFHPLDQWLLQRQIPLDDLQAAVDQLLERFTTEDTEGHGGEGEE